MTPGEGRSERSGLPESLRTAVERTIEATTGTASETAGRAQELLDEVARRGQGAREGIAGIRFATSREVGELAGRLDRIEARLTELEAQAKSQPEG